MPDDQRRFIHPSASKWKLKEQERELYDAAEDVPNWRLADKSRRLLLDMAHELSLGLEGEIGKPIKDLEPVIAQRLATIALSNLTVRAAGSALALISCGYVGEAGGPIRRCVEAGLRVRAVAADDSGQHAREWLAGRPKGNPEKLAQKYGKSEDLRLLSMFAHADVRGLMPLLTGPRGLGDAIDLRPNRTSPEAAPLLHAIAHQSVMMCVALAEVFGVSLALNPWVASELERLKGVVEELNAHYRPLRER